MAMLLDAYIAETIRTLADLGGEECARITHLCAYCSEY
jgi:hypothetical protein